MKKSFSLIELLIVVTIISVLSGAALPFVSEYLETSRIAKAKNDLDEIARAIAAYEVQTGKTYADTTGKVLLGRFIQKLPNDPWGAPYSLASATDELGCKICSKGPDGVLGNGETDGGSAAHEDNIVQAYKGPLALVSATWYDTDQDSTVNNGDTLKIKWNRNPDGVTGIAVANYATASGATPVAGVLLSNLCTAAGTKSGRTITFSLAAAADKDVALGSLEIGPVAPAGVPTITDPQGIVAIVSSITLKAY